MNNKKPIHIFGHMNPDTDSTCAAISYAYLKNIIDPNNKYIPAILGNINNETKFVLKNFDFTPPKVIKHLKPQVSDIEFKTTEFVYETDSVKKVLETISSQVGRTVSVVDKDEKLLGIVSISDLLPLLLKTYSSENMRNIMIPIKNILEELELTKIYGEISIEYTRGNIYIFNELSSIDIINNDDIILCNKEDVQEPRIFSLGAGIIIIADVDNIKEISEIENTDSIVFFSKKTMYELIQDIFHSLPIIPAVKKDQLEYFTTYETIDDVRNNMLTSKHRRFPVVDEQGFIKGMISRSNLIDVEQKKVILVDHNEKGQSIEGVESVTIVEVIDHHRVADIQTISPLYFRVEPVGSTCTIIGKIFNENNIEIPKNIAGLLLSGILSDTLVFKSPTCTDEDKEMAEKLSKICGKNIYNYGMAMITNGEDIKGKTPEQIINTDMKRFTFGRYKVVISQINTADFKGIYKIYPQIIESMENLCKLEGFHLSVLMITNIVVGGTEVIATGEARWIAENAFNMGKNDISIFLNQTFSRKKQIVPRLMKATHL